VVCKICVWCVLSRSYPEEFPGTAASSGIRSIMLLTCAAVNSIAAVQLLEQGLCGRLCMKGLQFEVWRSGYR
jgi:hypothetical protein